jgi:hypothetical protein
MADLDTRNMVQGVRQTVVLDLYGCVWSDN